MRYEELYALLRRRGVLWPSAELYGGTQGLYDYGPAGAALKRRVEEAWRRWFVGLSDDYYLIQPAEILPEAVVRASGHLANFTDPEVTCGQCHSVFRADTLLEKVRPEGVDGLTPIQIADLLAAHHPKCPTCGSTELSVPRPFNLMFPLELGATGRERGYLAPETAQASYLSFPRMFDVGRKALPLGIAVIGKAYRNEIAPRQVLFRMRAFTQAELQIFFDPEAFPVPIATVAEERLPVLSAEARAAGRGSADRVAVRDLIAGGMPEFYAYHLAVSYRFYRDVLGYPESAIRLFEKSAQERAFYNRIQFDIEVELPSLGGFKELGAVHYRGDYDLGRHGEGTGKDLSVHVEGKGRRLPHVLELTFGVDRNLWALADRHLVVEGERTVWKLPPWLAPFPVGVFPLLKKDHSAHAQGIADRLRDHGLDAEFDAGSSIGRRYARMDEIGTPFCVTVDGGTIDPDSPDHGTVTVRLRDAKTQERVAEPELAERLRTALVPPRVGTAPRGATAA